MKRRELIVDTAVQTLKPGTVYNISEIADTCGRNMGIKKKFSVKETAIFLRYRDDMKLVSEGRWMRTAEAPANG